MSFFPFSNFDPGCDPYFEMLIRQAPHGVPTTDESRKRMKCFVYDFARTSGRNLLYVACDEHSGLLCVGFAKE